MRLVIIFLLATLSQGFAADRGGVRAQDVVKVDFLPGWRTSSDKHLSAIRISLAKGWKTYWRHPGDAGIAPRFDFSGSKNLRQTQFTWPLPHVFNLGGVQTIGYDGELILPLYLKPVHTGRDIHLSLKMYFGVCETVCMPVEITLNKRLKPASRSSDWRIKSALNQRLDTAKEAGLRHMTCDLRQGKAGLSLRIGLQMPPIGSRETALVEPAEDWMFVEKSTSKRVGDRLIIDSDLMVAADAPSIVDRSKIRITVLGADRGVSILGCFAHRQ